MLITDHSHLLQDGEGRGQGHFGGIGLADAIEQLRDADILLSMQDFLHYRPRNPKRVFALLHVLHRDLLR